MYERVKIENEILLDQAKDEDEIMQDDDPVNQNLLQMVIIFIEFMHLLIATYQMQTHRRHGSKEIKEIMIISNLI